MKSINLSGISKSFKKKQVLRQVDLQVNGGEIFGILGPSGCGKTTTVKIIAGVLEPDGGMVKVLDRDMPDLEVMGHVGYMAQSDALYMTLSALENLEFFGKIYGLKGEALRERIRDVAGLVDLGNDLRVKAGSYSGGMKRRLSLAIALLADPQVLLLDEPTVGIDPVLRRSIWKELRRLAEQGVTILITTHVMDEAAKCDRLAMMRGGSIIAQGTPEEIIREAGRDTLEKAFIHFGKERGADEN